MIDDLVQDPQDPPEGKVRLLRLLKARADALQKPVFYDDGSIAIPAEPASTAMRTAIHGLKGRLMADPESADAFRAYLSGTGEIPKGWIPDSTPIRSKESIMRDAAEQQASAQNPVAKAAFDYVVDPLLSGASNSLQMPVNLGIGAYNWATGNNINTPSVKAAATAMGQQLLGKGGKTFAETYEGTKQQLEAAESVAGPGAGLVRGAAELVSTARSFAGKDLGKVVGKVVPASMAPGAWAASKVAKVVEKLSGKELPEIIKKAMQLSGGMATYEAVKAKEGERLSSAGWGALAGTAMTLGGEVGKWGFKKILQSGLTKLGPDEKAAVDALKTWAQKNKIFPTPQQTKEAYLEGMVNQWVDAGAPGAKMPFRKLFAYAMQGGIEATGFSLLDAQFREDLMAAATHGDVDKLASALEKFGANALGAAALHVPLRDIVPWQRKQVTPTGSPPTPAGIPPAPIEPAPPGTKQIPQRATAFEEKVGEEGVRRYETGEQPLQSEEAAKAFDVRRRAEAQDPGEQRRAEARRTATEAARQKEAKIEHDLARLGWTYVPAAPPGVPQLPAIAEGFTQKAGAEGVQQIEAGTAGGKTDEQLAKEADVRRQAEAQDPGQQKRAEARRTAEEAARTKDLTQYPQTGELGSGIPRLPVEGKPGEANTPEQQALVEQIAPITKRYEIPGTNYWFEVERDIAKPSPKLRGAFGLPESMPAADFYAAIEKASLLNALHAKAMLPGTEISVEGPVLAEPGEGDAEGVMRRMTFGDVQEAPLRPDGKFKTPDGPVPARGKDALSPFQDNVVSFLRGALNRRQDLPQDAKVLLGGIIDVLDTVAADNDQSVAEMLGTIQDVGRGIATGSPEHAAQVIKAAAEMLTVKHPDVAIDDLMAEQAAARPMPAEPEKTGSQAVGSYHGAASEIGKLDEGYYSGRNIYGEGFYATDNPEIAKSYTKKNRKDHPGGTPTVYRVSERLPVKFYDLDARLTPEVVRHLEDAAKSSESVGDAISEVESGGISTLGEVMDHARGVSRANNESADDLTEAFDFVKERLMNMGYGGFTHVGGKKTKGEPHNVRIYWQPETQIGLEPAGPTEAMGGLPIPTKLLANIAGRIGGLVVDNPLLRAFTTDTAAKIERKVGKPLADQIRRAEANTRRDLKLFEPTLREMAKLGKGRVRELELIRWQPAGPTGVKSGYTLGHILKETRLMSRFGVSRSSVSPEAQQWLKLWDEAHYVTREKAHDLGVEIRNLPLQGGARTKVAQTATRDVMTRQFTPEASDALLGGGKLRTAIVDALAEENGMTTQQVEKVLEENGWTEARGVSKTNPLEIRRMFEFMPDHIEVGGEVHRILETHPLRHAKRLIHQAAMQLGTIEEFGQDIAPTTAQTQPGYVGNVPTPYRHIVESVDKRHQDLVATALRASMGMALNKPLLTPGDPGYKEVQGLFAAIDVLAASKMTMSWVQNLTEGLGTASTFLGFDRFAAGYGKAWDALIEGGLTRLVEQRADIGGFSVHIPDWVVGGETTGVEKMQDVARVIANAELFPFDLTQTLTDTGIHIAIEKAIADMQAGRGRASDAAFAQLVGFSEAEAEAMAKGNGTPEQYERLQLGGLSRITRRGDLPINKSTFGNSRYLSRLVRLTNYIQRQLETVRTLMRRMRDAKTNAEGGKAMADFAKLATFNMLAGMAAGSIMSFLRQHDGFSRWWREAYENPGYTATAAILSTLAGGMGSAVAGAFTALIMGTDDEKAQALDRAADLFLPLSFAIDTAQFATAAIKTAAGEPIGEGPYAGKTPLQQLGYFVGQQVPAARTVEGGIFGLGATYLGTDPKIEADLQANNRWERRNNPGRDFTVNPDKQFVDTMRSVETKLRAKDGYNEDDIEAAIREAMPEKDDKAVHASFLRRRVLVGERWDSLSEEQQASKVRFLGKETVERLQGYDAALDAMAERFKARKRFR